MREFSVPELLSNYISELKAHRKTIGFVPTMGALHEGHLSLIRKSKEENDLTVVSIFVNPLQFNNEGDLSKYPRTMESDKNILEKSDVDILFAPSENDMYPLKPSISVDFGSMANVLEGKFREGHFAGVGVVVGKLLHITSPDRAYFGLKDLQQFLLIKKLSTDLNFPVKVIGVDTVRDENGLALSSRNARLTSEGLLIASSIYAGLKKAENKIKEKASIESIQSSITNFYKSISGLDMEYFELVDANNLQPITTYDELDELAICVAGYVDGIRLIDNLYLRLK
ncbi:MAG: pantoate--beta-alanine ligase [Ekhidna sp.]